MPTWLQWLLWIAAALVASGTILGSIGAIWIKVIRPLIRFIRLMTELAPIFQKLPDVFDVLAEIAAQFRTDSGSSLRDAVDGLTRVAAEQKAAAELLKVGVEASKILSAEDRLALNRLPVLLDRLEQKIDAGAATGLRNEAAAKVVADDLAHKT